MARRRTKKGVKKRKDEINKKELQDSLRPLFNETYQIFRLALVTAINLNTGPMLRLDLMIPFSSLESLANAILQESCHCCTFSHC